MLIENLPSWSQMSIPTYTTQAALLLHSTEHRARHGELTVDVMSFHPIEEGKLREGMIINHNTLIDMLLAKQSHQSESAHWLEPTTLVRQHDLHVWYRPVMRRPLRMQAANQSHQFWVQHFPSTLFAYRPSSSEFFLFALETDSRPSLDTTLYQLPVGNVSSVGRLCLGSADSFLVDQPTQSDYAKMERCFFDALSTHTSTNYLFLRDKEKQKKTPFSRVISFWKKQAKTNSKVSVKDELIPLGSVRELVFKE